MYPVSFSLTKSSFSFLVILLFGYVIIQSNNFAIQHESLNINTHFVGSYQHQAAINLDSIDLVEIKASDHVMRHVVQRGETLGAIATKYGTTISKIKELNGVTDFLRVGQEIFITNVPGIIHTTKEESNFLVFANRYELSLEDLMTLNYVSQPDTVIDQGSELFLPITIEKAYQLGIEQKPKPRPKPVVTARPTPTTTVASRPATTTRTVATPVTQPARTTASRSTATAAKPASGPYAGQVIATWYDGRPTIHNGFYKGHCTYYAATKRGDIFTYTAANKQNKPFGGNAKQRYHNAQAAGYHVGQSPAVNAIAVFANGGAGYRGYGHVAIVIKVDHSRGIMLIEEMNGPSGLGYVDQRWVGINDGVIGYIY